MISTLIIFLFFIFIGLVFILSWKVPIIFKLNIQNNDLMFEYKAFFKERHIKNKVTDFFKSGSAEFDKKILVDVSEVIDIENLKTEILVGTPFIALSNLGVLFFSFAVPTIYRMPFAKKNNLYFKVLPQYDDWNFKLFISGEIRVSIISVFFIIFKMKKRLSKSKKNNV